MNTTLFAHTEAGGSRPGYINIRRTEDGVHFISVRSRGQDYPSTIEVTPELLEAFAAELMAKLNGEDPAAATTKEKL